MAKARNKPKTTTPPRTGSRTVERRRERERERRRQRLIVGGIAVLALVVVAVVIYFIVNAPAEAPIPQDALTRYDGIQETRTELGFPRLGDPNAPVQVAEYSSFGCPHCRDFHDQAIDQIVERVRAGGVAFTYVPLYGYGGLTNEQGAALAAVCAGEQGKFWQFHDALFDWQGLYGNQAFSNNRITAGVDALELDKNAYNACIGSSAANDVLAAALTQAKALLNFQGTPTITINGVIPLDDNQQPISDPTQIMARIDAEIARLGALSTPEPTSAAPVEATAETTPEMTEATAEATEAAVAPAISSTAEATAETTPAS